MAQRAGSWPRAASRWSRVAAAPLAGAQSPRAVGPSSAAVGAAPSDAALGVPGRVRDRGGLHVRGRAAARRRSTTWPLDATTTARASRPSTPTSCSTRSWRRSAAARADVCVVAFRYGDAAGCPRRPAAAHRGRGRPPTWPRASWPPLRDQLVAYGADGVAVSAGRRWTAHLAWTSSWTAEPHPGRRTGDTLLVRSWPAQRWTTCCCSTERDAVPVPCEHAGQPSWLRPRHRNRSAAVPGLGGFP